MRDYRARPTLLPSTRSSSLIDQFSYELRGKFKEALAVPERMCRISYPCLGFLRTERGEAPRRDC